MDVNEAGAILPQLVAAAESGETVMLTRGGQPVVELVRLRPVKSCVRVDRNLGLSAECRCQSLLVWGDPDDAEIMQWLEAVTDRRGWV